MRRLRAGPTTNDSPVPMLPGTVGPGMDGFSDPPLEGASQATAGPLPDIDAVDTAPGLRPPYAPHSFPTPRPSETWDEAAESAAIITDSRARRKADAGEDWKVINGGLVAGLALAAALAGLLAAAAHSARQAPRTGPKSIVRDSASRHRGS